MNRVTSEIVESIARDQIFVFGSNEAGRHGKGAAKLARKWGAEYGNPSGRQGSTYAIPTKDKKVKTLPIENIKTYVDQFISYAEDNPEFHFLVTEIGCGLAGYHPSDIAPLFSHAINIENIWLPIRFWHILNGVNVQQA